HQDEGGGGVLRLRSPERGHAVADRLDPGEGDGTGGEPFQDEEQPQRPSRLPRALERRLVEGHFADTAEVAADEADDDERGEGDDVDVRRRREQPSGFLDAAQVRDRDERDQAETQLDTMRGQTPEGGDRDDGGDTRGDRHRHREDVVDEQRRAGDQRWGLAEVPPADDVAPTAAGVGEDRLAVRRAHDGEEDRDRDRDRDERVEPQRQARSADGGDEEDLLRRVH